MDPQLSSPLPPPPPGDLGLPARLCMWVSAGAARVSLRYPPHPQHQGPSGSCCPGWGLPQPCRACSPSSPRCPAFDHPPPPACPSHTIKSTLCRFHPCKQGEQVWLGGTHAGSARAWPAQQVGQATPPARQAGQPLVSQCLELICRDRIRGSHGARVPLQINTSMSSCRDEEHVVNARFGDK